MTSLEIGKLTEKKGLETLIITAVAVVVFSAWVFYAYAWRAVSQTADSVVTAPITEDALIKYVESDLNDRAAKLKKLEAGLLVGPDIFR